MPPKTYEEYTQDIKEAMSAGQTWVQKRETTRRYLGIIQLTPPLAAEVRAIRPERNAENFARYTVAMLESIRAAQGRPGNAEQLLADVRAFGSVVVVSPLTEERLHAVAALFVRKYIPPRCPPEPLAAAEAQLVFANEAQRVADLMKCAAVAALATLARTRHAAAVDLVVCNYTISKHEADITAALIKSPLNEDEVAGAERLRLSAKGALPRARQRVMEAEGRCGAFCRVYDQCLAHQTDGMRAVAAARKNLAELRGPGPVPDEPSAKRARSPAK